MKTIKSKWQKFIITFLITLMLFNVVFPHYSCAEFDGGTLFEPIAQWICGVGDVILNVMQTTMLPGAPKAVDTRTVADLLSEDLMESDNWQDKIEGLGMKTEQFIDSIPLIGDIYRGTSSVLKGSNVIGTIKGMSKNVKDKGPLALLNPLGASLREMDDNYEGYYELYRKKTIIPFILYGPAAIFSNMVPALDANFISPDTTKKYVTGNLTYNLELDKWERGAKAEPDVDFKEDNSADSEEKIEKANTAKNLQPVIAKWYVALRNIALVAMLSVLVYVAIRIILSSTAGETAKYKTLLKDWFVGICLLFVLHYMMAFILKSAEIVTDLFTSGENLLIGNDEEHGATIDIFMTNSRNLAVGIVDSDVEEPPLDLGDMFGYTLIYCVLVFYTLIFTWKYIKRVVYLAFLTVISPLVAFTYPIDKMKDGSAQAFNMWIKEYTYNVLMQPLHLLLYFILIGSVQDLATDNMLYAVVALGFLLEAEKIFKSLFGFNKASGGGLSAAVTGGAIFGSVAGMTKKLAGKLPGGSSDKKGSGSSSESSGKDKIYMNRSADSDKKATLASAFGGSAIGGSTGSAIGGPTGSVTGGPTGSVTGGSRRNNGTLGTMPIRLGTGQRSGLSTRLNNSQFANKHPRIIRGVKGIGSGLGSVAKRYVNKDNAFKAVKTAAKISLTAGGAAVGGTIGLAAGLASDNPADALKYAAMGAGAGALVGNKSVGAAVTAKDKLISSATGIRDDFQKGYYGDEYKDKVLNPKLDKQWMKDKDTIEHYKDKYGSKDYKDAMENALELRKRGIVDQKELDQAQKMMTNHPNLSFDQAASIMDFQRDFAKKDLVNNREKIKEKAENLVGDSEKAENIVKKMEENFKLN